MRLRRQTPFKHPLQIPRLPNDPVELEILTHLKQLTLSISHQYQSAETPDLCQSNILKAFFRIRSLQLRRLLKTRSCTPLYTAFRNLLMTFVTLTRNKHCKKQPLETSGLNLQAFSPSRNSLSPTRKFQSQDTSSVIECVLLGFDIATLSGIDWSSDEVVYLTSCLLDLYSFSNQKNPKQFTQVNFALHELFLAQGVPDLSSCFEYFLAVYGYLRFDSQKMQAVHLFALILRTPDQNTLTLRKNTLVLQKIQWLGGHFLDHICTKLRITVKQLSKNITDVLADNEFFITKLVDKMLDLAENNGFVSQPRLFQQAYQTFHIQHILLVLATLGRASLSQAQKIILLMAEHDYFPRGSIKLLGRIFSNLREYPELQHLTISTSKTSTNKQDIFFMPFSPSNGILKIICRLICELKWDCLEILEALMFTQHKRALQEFFIKNDEFIEFLIEGIARSKIPTSSFGVASSFLTKFTEGNTKSLVRVYQILLKHNNIDNFTDNLSKYLEVASGFVLALLSSYAKLRTEILKWDQVSEIRKTSNKVENAYTMVKNEFVLKANAWFLVTLNIKPVSQKNRFRMQSLRVMLWLVAEDRQQLTQHVCLWTMLQQKRTTLSFNNPILRYLVNETVQWLDFYDRHERREIQEVTQMDYCFLRVAAQSILECFDFLR